MYYLVLFLTLIIVCSCSSNIPKSRVSVIKDSAIQSYIKYLNSFSYIDSTREIRLLVDLNNSDTTELKRSIQVYSLESNEYHYEDRIDTCISETKIKDIDCDEAYRFEYSNYNIFVESKRYPNGSCPYFTHFTIYKKDSVIKLVSLIYQKSTKTEKCKIVKEQTENLDYSHWIAFQAIMKKNDFWGLKRFNGQYGDGLLKIWGIKHELWRDLNFTHYNYIFREDVNHIAISDALVYLSKVSKFPIYCY
ncbi:MAG: hypothetical protein IPI46_09290 [Bacteroidetes bacterium]|nr:hypothetical protein [Bacteroidota bacterium]